MERGSAQFEDHC